MLEIRLQLFLDGKRLTKIQKSAWHSYSKLYSNEFEFNGSELECKFLDFEFNFKKNNIGTWVWLECIAKLE